MKDVGLFVHVPVVVFSVEPTRAMPEIDGWPLFFDGAVTTAVGFDATVVDPSELDAVTRTRIRLPTSRFPRTWLCVVAPAIVVQSEPSGFPPDVGQRTHWYLKDVGLLLHVPAVAVSVDPSTAFPEIVGSLVLTGAA